MRMNEIGIRKNSPFCAAFARLVNDAATAQSGETGRQAVSTALLLLPGRLHGRLLLVLHGRLAALGIVAALLLVASLRGTVGLVGDVSDCSAFQIHDCE